MTPQALRKFALSLPETHEAPHFERASFRVGKRIFLTLTRDGREAMVKMPAPDEAEDWIAARPEVFVSYGTWTSRNGALGVLLARAEGALVRELVLRAWSAVAPKRARAAYRQSEDGA